MPNRIIINGCFLQHNPTGVQRYAWEVTKRLLQLQVDAYIVTPENLQISQYYGRIPQASLLKWGTMPVRLWEQIVLPRMLEKGDVLWTPAGLGPLYGVRRHLLTIHDISVIEHPEWFSKNYARFYKFLQPIAIRDAARIITVSQYSSSRLQQCLNVPASKIDISLNAADEIFTSEPSSKDSDVILKYKLPEKYLLAVGSLEPRKNLVRLIEAYQSIRTEIPDVTLVLVGEARSIYGDSNLNPNLYANVIFTGYVPSEHLPALYRGALAFAYPSIYEGFGIPPLEAMACGLPVLTSNSTSLPEVVGDAALLVNPENVKEIANGLLRLVCDDDLREDLQQKGLERAQMFSWKNTTQAVLNALGKVCNEILP